MTGHSINKGMLVRGTLSCHQQLTSFMLNGNDRTEDFLRLCQQPKSSMPNRKSKSRPEAKGLPSTTRTPQGQVHHTSVEGSTIIEQALPAVCRTTTGSSGTNVAFSIFGRRLKEQKENKTKKVKKKKKTSRMVSVLGNWVWLT